VIGEGEPLCPRAMQRHSRTNACPSSLQFGTACVHSNQIREPCISEQLQQVSVATRQVQNGVITGGVLEFMQEPQIGMLSAGILRGREHSDRAACVLMVTLEQSRVSGGTHEVNLHRFPS